MGEYSRRDIATLAEAKAECIYNLNFKKCTPAACQSCPHGAKLALCYSSLALCDQLRLDMDANEIAKEKINWKNSSDKRKHSNKRWLIGLWTVTAILVIAIVIGMIATGAASFAFAMGGVIILGIICFAADITVSVH